MSDSQRRMDKSWINIYDRINDTRYEAGVIEFLDFAYRGRDESLTIPCLCRSCNNFRDKYRETIYNHLIHNGITKGYTTWNYHGEESNNDDGGGGDDVSFDGSDGGGDDMSDDDLDEMLDNIGCQTFSKFSFVVAILHLKTTSGCSMKLFNATLDLFRKALPAPSLVPKNFYEAKKLQRLFIDKQVASDMRWHKEKRVHDDNIARHPADTEAWKHLNKIDPPFARDPRNIRLGLAIDGFKPFGNLSSSYSICPVFIVPYNLPPWKCMKDPNMFMSMLISGPKTPVNIDVYLEPLIDELKDLWAGVDAYDALRKEDFTSCAALLWTINDFFHMDKTNFDWLVDNREPITPKSTDEVLHDIDCSIGVSDSVVNKKKRQDLRHMEISSRSNAPRVEEKLTSTTKWLIIRNSYGLLPFDKGRETQDIKFAHVTQFSDGLALNISSA
nr:hypothetical protein [Tanacetum cinerariifolium]